MFLVGIFSYFPEFLDIGYCQHGFSKQVTTLVCFLVFQISKIGLKYQ